MAVILPGGGQADGAVREGIEAWRGEQCADCTRPTGLCQQTDGRRSGCADTCCATEIVMHRDQNFRPNLRIQARGRATLTRRSPSATDRGGTRAGCRPAPPDVCSRDVGRREAHSPDSRGVEPGHRREACAEAASFLAVWNIPRSPSGSRPRAPVRPPGWGLGPAQR